MEKVVNYMIENRTHTNMKIRKAPVSGWEPSQSGHRSTGSTIRPAHLPPLVPMEERSDPLQKGVHVLFEKKPKEILEKKPNRPIW